MTLLAFEQVLLSFPFDVVRSDRGGDRYHNEDGDNYGRRKFRFEKPIGERHKDKEDHSQSEDSNADPEDKSLHFLIHSPSTPPMTLDKEKRVGERGKPDHQESLLIASDCRSNIS